MSYARYSCALETRGGIIILVQLQKYFIASIFKPWEKKKNGLNSKSEKENIHLAGTDLSLGKVNTL